jgi:hypothetical protein
MGAKRVFFGIKLQFHERLHPAGVAFVHFANARLQDDLRRGTRRFAPFPVLAKNEPLARFSGARTQH